MTPEQVRRLADEFGFEDPNLLYRSLLEIREILFVKKSLHSKRTKHEYQTRLSRISSSAKKLRIQLENLEDFEYAAMSNTTRSIRVNVQSFLPKFDKIELVNFIGTSKRALEHIERLADFGCFYADVHAREGKKDKKTRGKSMGYIVTSFLYGLWMDLKGEVPYIKKIDSIEERFDSPFYQFVNTCCGSIFESVKQPSGKTVQSVVKKLSGKTKKK